MNGPGSFLLQSFGGVQVIGGVHAEQGRRGALGRYLSTYLPIGWCPLKLPSMFALGPTYIVGDYR